MPLANKLDCQPERTTVPEPSWWNMAIAIIIVGRSDLGVAGVTLGFIGVM
jgi:hypothetical protein